MKMTGKHTLYLRSTYLPKELEKQKNIHLVLLQYLQVTQEWFVLMVISCF